MGEDVATKVLLEHYTEKLDPRKQLNKAVARMEKSAHLLIIFDLHQPSTQHNIFVSVSLSLRFKILNKLWRLPLLST